MFFLGFQLPMRVAYARQSPILRNTQTGDSLHLDGDGCAAPAQEVQGHQANQVRAGEHHQAHAHR